MNQPIGIPSGWEEIAAWAYAALILEDAKWTAAETLSEDYIFPASNYNDPKLPHDWRVED